MLTLLLPKEQSEALVRHAPVWLQPDCDVAVGVLSVACKERERVCAHAASSVCLEHLRIGVSVQRRSVRVGRGARHVGAGTHAPRRYCRTRRPSAVEEEG